MWRTSLHREHLPADSEFERIATNIVDVRIGDRHMILKTVGEQLLGWGVNKNAQLGIGNYEFMYEKPVLLPQPVSLSYNGESVGMNNGVVVRNDLAFVPLRSVFEKMGAELTWDAIRKRVVVERHAPGEPALRIEIDFENEEMRLNGEIVPLAHDPFILQGTTYLPLRFISESLGAKVHWQDAPAHIDIRF